jgi:hypothetical protein
MHPTVPNVLKRNVAEGMPIRSFHSVMSIAFKWLGRGLNQCSGKYLCPISQGLNDVEFNRPMT